MCKGDDLPIDEWIRLGRLRLPKETEEDALHVGTHQVPLRLAPSVSAARHDGGHGKCHGALGRKESSIREAQRLGGLRFAISAPLSDLS